MVKKKLKAKTFQGMSYRKIQRKNSRNRNLLIREHQKWLKNNGYLNIGWNNVISLYQAISELQRKEQISELNLEELFLEADRIGNKYFSKQEIHNKQQKIAQELNEITEIIDSQFPDNKIEFVDYSKSNLRISKKRNRIKARWI